ncbi:MAG TPA: lipopolysaccharide assembly protein LapA domain-containing protein [Thermodesulfobacteriota bacterium]|nr:lipopolysaccharide assembly protein LapA domain-containing protein [Thermodesulfobacteriota bacterium]
MRAFFGVGFLLVILIAIFAVQNSSAAPVMIKFLFWKFETSLVYTIFGAIVLGILLTLSFWIGKTIHASIRRKELPKEIDPA